MNSSSNVDFAADYLQTRSKIRADFKTIDFFSAFAVKSFSKFLQFCTDFPASFLWN